MEKVEFDTPFWREKVEFDTPFWREKVTPRFGGRKFDARLRKMRQRHRAFHFQ
jgi:hypothetical protein